MIQFKPSFLGRENTEMSKKLKILNWFKEHRLTMKLWDVREAEEREKFLWVWHDLGTKPPPPKHHFIHAISSFDISNGKINLPTYLEGIRDSQLINITTVLQFHFFSGPWFGIFRVMISSVLGSIAAHEKSRGRENFEIFPSCHWVQSGSMCIIHYLEKATNWLVLNRDPESFTGKGNEVCIWEKNSVWIRAMIPNASMEERCYVNTPSSTLSVIKFMLHL